MIYVVLGMHKSGTTLLSQLLHESGIPMLDEEGEQAGYDRGHKFEDAKFRGINSILLGSSGRYSLEIPLPGSLEWGSDVEDAARDLVGQREDSSSSSWGFKDPRTTLTYPFWREVLPEHRLLGVYRSPFEVWMHYGRRWRNLWSVMRHWTEHNRRLLSYLEDEGDRGFLVAYHELMTSDEPLDRLEAFLGRGVEDVRDPSLYRSRVDPDWWTRSLVNLMGGLLPEDPMGLWDRLEAVPRRRPDGG